MQNQLYFDVQGLAAQRMKAAHSTDSAALKGAARQFESLFTGMMTKSMRDASFGETLFSSDQGQLFEEMLDKQLLSNLDADGHDGLAAQISRQVQHIMPSTRDVVAADEAEPAAKKVQNKSYSFMPITDDRINPLWRKGAGAVRAQIASTLTDPSASSKEAKPYQREITVDLRVRRPSGLTQSTVAPKRQLAELNVQPVVPLKSEPLPDLSSWDGPAEFVKDVYPHAVGAAQRLGVDPKVLVAQAALETGWGKHLPKNEQGEVSYNLFGIKAGKSWKGERVNISTQEFENGQFNSIKDDFRAYRDISQSFSDYADLIAGNKRYHPAIAVADNPESYAHALQSAGYATDPRYAQKIISIYNGSAMKSAFSDIKTQA